MFLTENSSSQNAYRQASKWEMFEEAMLPIYLPLEQLCLAVHNITRRWMEGIMKILYVYIGIAAHLIEHKIP